MYQIAEQSDVFVDAALPDHKGQLLFISVYGRDTSVQQFMARLHQARREGGVDELNLYPAGEPAAKDPLLVMPVGDARRLEKVNGRLPRGLLGVLVHVWIFDPALLEVDRATRVGWAIDHHAVPYDAGSLERLNAQAWHLVKQLSPVPLLEHWRDPVMSHLRASDSLIHPVGLGPLRAQRVELARSFASFVSEHVRSGALTESIEVPA